MEKIVYKQIDEFLERLENESFGMKIPFDRSWPIGTATIKAMMKHELAEFDVVKKNLKGADVLKYGGYEKWITDKENDEKEKNRLEREKLKYDVGNAKRIYKTYWLTFWMALIAFAISVILGMKQLLEKPSQPPANTQSLVKPSNEEK